MSKGSGKMKIRTRKRMGNEFTDRARVQLKFCSHSSHFPFPFGRSSFPVPRFIIILKTDLMNVTITGNNE